MFFDLADIELIRLVGWFKNLPTEAGKAFSSQVLNSVGIDALQSLGYLSITPNNDFYRLKPQGRALLNSLGFNYPQDSKYVSVDKTLARRKEAAEIMLTFYRSGCNIFSDVISALNTPNNYLSAMAIRRNEDTPSNIFGGARFAGIGRNMNNTYLCYYADSGQIYHTNERRFFMNAISAIQCNPATLYFGKSYSSIATLISKKPTEPKKQKNNSITFYEAYRKSTMPIHLIECSDTGATQLLLMGQENYRVRMAELVLGEQYTPPHEGVTTSDASFKDSKLPVVIGIDMDIKHICTVYRQAKENGFDWVAIIAFKEQLPTLASLCSSIKPELFGIDRLDILAAMDLKLYEPKISPYTTPKGEYIHIENFTESRKARKSDRP